MNLREVNLRAADHRAFHQPETTHTNVWPGNSGGVRTILRPPTAKLLSKPRAIDFEAVERETMKR